MKRIAVPLFLALSSTGLVAQRTPKPNQNIAARARVLIEQEGNLKEALKLLESNLEQGSPRERRLTRLWLGHALARIGKAKEARARWKEVAKGSDDLARAANAALTQKSDRVARHVITLIGRLATAQDQTQTQRELLWLGDASRPRLLETVTRKRLEMGETSLELAKRVFQILIALGGEGVPERIKELSQSKDVLIRRAVVHAWKNSPLDAEQHKDCRRAMRAYLQDPVESMRLESFNYCVNTLSFDELLDLAENNPACAAARSSTQSAAGSPRATRTTGSRSASSTSSTRASVAPRRSLPIRAGPRP